jgi:hypothetical protein
MTYTKIVEEARNPSPSQFLGGRDGEDWVGFKDSWGKKISTETPSS